MLALVGTVMSRSPSGNVLLRYGDGVLGTHRVRPGRLRGSVAQEACEQIQELTCGFCAEPGAGIP
jgi:hypothetical protein